MEVRSALRTSGLVQSYFERRVIAIHIIGWVPMLLDRLQYGQRYGSKRHLFGDDDPIELFRRTFWFTTTRRALSTPRQERRVIIEQQIEQQGGTNA